jgi:D-alanyl-lipoteichoic acid acyltransferase DltB (MBOAT superfamily)
MLFASYEFIGLLFALLLVYYGVPRLFRGKLPSIQWPILLVFSYVFYFFCGASYLLFILFTTASSYAVARLIARHIRKEDLYLSEHGNLLTKEDRKARKAAGKRTRRIILAVGLILNFGLLAILKYTAFFVGNLNAALHLFGSEASIAVPSLILPMGISFYTFQTMGYLIDVYRRKTEAETNPARLALFVSFFPQLVQGPISRYSELAPQLYAPHTFSLEPFYKGLQRVLWGYCKKLIIADRIMIAIKTLLESPEQYKGMYVFLLVLFYSVQIYADFTGGIDITIGIAEMLGIRVAENFRRPFASRSTEEYWKRWHMTMGSWFQDYVFYPLAVSGSMLRLTKFCRDKLGKGVGRRISVYLCTIITWFLTGRWHGAAWNFIVWGLLNCAVLLISQELKPLYERFRKKLPRLTASGVYGAFMATRTFLLMGFIRVFDCYRNVPLTFSMIGSVFTVPNGQTALTVGIFGLGLSVFDFAILGVGILAMYLVSRLGDDATKTGSLRDKLWERPILSALTVGVMLAAILLLGIYGPGYDASQFIYDQF